MSRGFIVSLFGIGMTLGSGCGSKTLVRLGGGSLKSVVVFVFFGIAAYMTLKGLFGIWRTSWIDPVAIDLAARGIARQDLPTLAAAATGLPPKPLQLGIALAAAAAALTGKLAPEARIYVERRARDALPAMPAGWRELRAGRAGEVGYHLFAV